VSTSTAVFRDERLRVLHQLHSHANYVGELQQLFGVDPAVVI